MSPRHLPRLVILAALLLFTSSALARPRDRIPQRHRGDRTAERAGRGTGALAAKRQKIRDRLRALRAWELTEALSLDEATAARLFPILGRFDQSLGRAMASAAALRRKLRAAADDPKADPGKLSQLVDQALAAQRTLWELQEQRLRAVEKVLSPRQTAKIILVLPEIDRRIQRQIRRIVKRGRGRGATGQALDPFADSPAPARPEAEPVDPFGPAPAE